MTIYSHWINNVANDTYDREFFGRKSEQEAAAKAAEKRGEVVLNAGGYTVEPNAESVAKFMNDHACRSLSHHVVEEYVTEVMLGAK
jgi:hypothetical protein